MKKKKLLVTGGAGFIGSHVTQAALDKGFSVVVVDDLSHGRRANVPDDALFYKADVSDPVFEEIVMSERPDIVNHHAAQIDVRKAVEDPVADARINILGMLNVLQACIRAGVGRFIFASSGGAIYGEQDFFPATEEHPTRPVSPYGITKLAGEKYLDFYRRVFGLGTVILRYANVYGPRQDSQGDAGVVAIFTSRLLAGDETVIFGDGEQTRDYVFVEDVARANIMAMERPLPDGPVNIGTGVETSVNELHSLIARKAAKPDSPRHTAAKAGEVSRSCIDSARAGKLWGWTPTLPLADGIMRTIDWFSCKRA